MRTLLERRQLAVAHLVEDPAGVLVPEVIDAASLPVAESLQRARGELGREREGLEAREDAVAAEHGHEPRKSRGRQGPVPSDDGRGKPQSGQIDEAAAVRCLERVPVTLEPRGVVDPPLEAPLHVWSGLPLAPLVLRPGVGAAGAGGRDHVEVGGPRSLGLDLDLEGQALLVQLDGSGRGDGGHPFERLPAVPEHEAFLVDLRVVAPLLDQGVLDLEQVGEVAGGIDANGQVGRLLVVVQDRELLVEAVSDGPPADHRELRVDVDGARARDEEETRLEVLQVVDRE